LTQLDGTLYQSVQLQHYMRHEVTVCVDALDVITRVIAYKKENITYMIYMHIICKVSRNYVQFVQFISNFFNVNSLQMDILKNNLSKYVQLRPLVAKKHSIKTIPHFCKYLSVNVLSIYNIFPRASKQAPPTPYRFLLEHPLRVTVEAFNFDRWNFILELRSCFAKMLFAQVF
jgi:hypothetical protein